MPFISTNTWVLKILDGTMSHKMKALGGYALYDEAFAGAREDAFDPATELSKKHAQFLKEGKVWFIKDASSTGTFICVGGYKKGAQSQPIEIKRMQMFALGACGGFRPEGSPLIRTRATRTTTTTTRRFTRG